MALVVAVALPVLARSAGLPCPLAAPPSRGSQSRVLKVAYANNAVFNTNNVILISANAAPASSSSLGFRSLESTSANQPTLRGFRERIPELVPVLQSSRLFGLGSVALKLTTIPKTRTNKAFNLKIHIGSQLFTLSARVYAHHGLSNRPWVDVPTFTCSVTGATDGDGLGLGAVVLTGHHGKAFQMIRLSHSAAFGKSTSIDLKAFERIHHQLGDNYDTHILSLSGQYTLHFFGPSGDTPVRLSECTKEGSFGVSFDTFDGASIVSSSFLKPATTASISALTGDSSCAPMKRSRQRGSSVLNAAGASFRPARASVPSRSKAATITLSVKQEPIVKQEPESPPSMPSMEMESLLSNHVELTSLDLKSFDMSNAGNSFDWSQGMNSSIDAGILDTVQELPSFEMAPMLSPLSSYQPFPLPTFTFSSVDDVHMADDVFPECKTELPEMSLSNWDPLPSFSPPAAKPLTFDVFSSDLSRGVSDFNLI